MKEQWLEWAIELQSLAQAGLTYGKDIFRIHIILPKCIFVKSNFSVPSGLSCRLIRVFAFFPTKKLKRRKYIFKHATAKKNQRRHSADRLIKLQHKCSL